jgi:hypothetical protein
VAAWGADAICRRVMVDVFVALHLALSRTHRLSCPLEFGVSCDAELGAIE